jgi:hypothetical protein
MVAVRPGGDKETDPIVKQPPALLSQAMPDAARVFRRNPHSPVSIPHPEERFEEARLEGQGQ